MPTKAAVLPKSRVSTIALDPMTRVGGALAVRVETDGSKVTDAYTSARMFRGYETIIAGRDARDVIALSSRTCGWCGAVHQTTSSLATEMAWGLRPPPMGQVLRSIASCTEAIWIHAAFLAVRAGPDYCAGVIQRTTPWVWQKALKTPAPGAAYHGFRTIADLMEGLTPVSGRYWHETLPAGRRVLEMINLMYGKYPHPSILTPGGVGSTLTIGNFTEYYTRLYRSVDYVKQVIAIWDDLCDFLPEADPRFAELGERPASFIHAGAWDDVRAYDGRYDTLDAWGRMRMARPGVMVDGRLMSDGLREINAGIEESVDHSFFVESSARTTDPAGTELSSRHPWSRATVPAPGPVQWGGRYSWCTAPRWFGNVVESTPLGRLWLAASHPTLPENQFIEPTGTGIRILVPENFLPETIVEWKIPERVNTLERLRADAYGIAYAGLCAALALLTGFELTRSAETSVSTKFAVPKEPTMGVGLWESGRGTNIHWMKTKGGRVENYQIMTPSTFNASPRDSAGRPGPIEEALIGSPIIEEPLDGRLLGIDAARVVRSFDPCMNCAAH